MERGEQSPGQADQEGAFSRRSGVGRPGKGRQEYSPSPACQGDPDWDESSPRLFRRTRQSAPSPIRTAHPLSPGPTALQTPSIYPFSLPRPLLSEARRDPPPRGLSHPLPSHRRAVLSRSVQFSCSVVTDSLRPQGL